MIVRSLSFSAKLLSIFSILTMMALVAFVVWVVTGPRSLESVTPYLEKELNSAGSDYTIKVSDSFIAWDGLERSFIIEMANVRLYDDTEVPVASFPKITFDFSVLNFLRGRLLSPDLVLIKPTFYIDASDRVLYVKAKGDSKARESAFQLMSHILASHRNHSPIRSLKVVDADFFINNGISEFVWHVPAGYARLDNKEKTPKIISEFNVNYGPDETYFGITAERTENGLLDTTLAFKHFPSYAATDVFPRSELLKKLTFMASGSVSFVMEKQDTVSQLRFTLDRFNGTAHFPEYFPEPFAINNVKAQGDLYEGFSTMTLDHLEMDLNQSRVSLAGTVKNITHVDGMTPAFDGEVTVENLFVDHVKRYWPEFVFTKIREWVTSNITGGVITKAKGKFTFTEEDVKNIHAWQQTLQQMHDEGKESSLPPPVPETAIAAEINVQGTQVQYVPSYPVATEVDGVVKFTGHTMVVEATKGKLQDTLINRARVVMVNFWQRPIQLVIDGEYVGKAADAIEYLKLAMKNKEPTPFLENLYRSTGNMGGTFSLTLPIKKPLTYQDIDLGFSARFTETTLPEFIHGKDVTNATFGLEFADDVLKVIGNGTIDQVNFKAEYEKNFAQKTSRCHLESLISADEIRTLGFASIPFISNTFYLKADYEESAEGRRISGEADIEKSAISIPDYGLEKPANSKGLVTFNAAWDGSGAVDIPAFDMKADGIAVKGGLRVQDGKLAFITLEKAKYNGNDFTARYSTDAKAITLDVKGEMFDLAPLKLSQFFKGSGEEKKAIHFKAKLNNAKMKNGEVFTGLESTLECSNTQCRTFNLYAHTRDNGSLSMKLTPNEKDSSLVVESDNAGAVINAFGISSHIQGGKLSLNAAVSRKSGQTEAEGVINIRDFTAVKTPMLGKLLTLASLKGITDLLNNNGIEFARFEAPFTMSGGIIRVKEAKTSGASIGITADGTINMNDSTIDLEGAVVPAYAVNKVLGSIPLVGNLIVGKENEGIIATKYRIKGPYDDVKMSVNPLTILTPGFLRNIFDIL